MRRGSNGEYASSKPHHLWLGLAALVCMGCGARHFDGTVYEDDEAYYRVGTLSSEWQPITMDDNDLAWHQPRHQALIHVNATCDPSGDVPLRALTNHLLIGFTDREERAQERLLLDGREALRTHVIARLDGVPRELLLYVMKKNRCTYDLALIAPVGEAFSRAEEDFTTFVNAFSTRVAPR